MTKRIALVGHCGPDTSYLIMAAKKAAADAEIARVNTEDALNKFLTAGPGLLLVNRVLDGDFADENGIDLIRRAIAGRGEVKAILVSNYEEAQSAAVAAGAMMGFGKRDIGSPKVLEAIRGAL